LLYPSNLVDLHLLLAQKEFYEFESVPVFLCIYRPDDLYNNPEVGYALFNDHWWSEEVHNYIMSLLDDKKIGLIFSYPTPSGNGTFYFVTSCHGICK